MGSRHASTGTEESWGRTASLITNIICNLLRHVRFLQHGVTSIKVSLPCDVLAVLQCQDIDFKAKERE